MTSGLIIRTQELGGRLLTIGGDHARGIILEQPSLQADAFGPSGASFTLKRDPHKQYPDLRAYAPVVFERRGVPVWLGRIKQTPMTDGGTARSVTVQCEGQQYRLDDDVFDRTYVHADTAAWSDVRSHPDANLTAFTAAPTVTVGGGAILLQWPNAVPAPSFNCMGAFLDLGPSNLATAMTMIYASSANTGNNVLYIYGADDILDTGAIVGAGPLANNVYTSGRLNISFSAPKRYVKIFDYQAAAPYTPGADVWWRLTDVCIFTSNGYMLSPPATFDTNPAAGSSILVASMIVSDALDRATMQLSDDRSLISTTSFYIPAFAMSEPATPREAIEAANVYHRYRTRVRADNRFEFGPLPSLPTIDVGAECQFDEASAGDASEVYTSVIVTYTDARGDPQRVQRSQPATVSVLSAIQLSNPSFTSVGTTGWAPIWVIARDTGTFASSPASLKITPIPGGGYAGVGGASSSSWSGGTFIPGKSYELAFSYRTDTVGTNWGGRVYDANGALLGVASLASPPINTWIPISITFAPQTAGSPFFAVESNGSAARFDWIDSFLLSEFAATLVDRWGFKRTKIIATNMTLTPAGAQQIADIFLEAHLTTPLKGKLIIPGDGRARRVPGGAPMRCEELLAETQSLVRMRHLIDPDTGKLGRIGRIATVDWDGASNTATVDIDSSSTNFEAMLARMALITGQVK